jgi:hypothetical protein
LRQDQALHTKVISPGADRVRIAGPSGTSQMNPKLMFRAHQRQEGNMQLGTAP